MQQVYDYLFQHHNIGQQTSSSHIKRFPPRSGHYLEYRNINNNASKGKRKQAKIQYDYNVQNVQDLARLFLPSHMAKFSGFDETMDASALLGLMINVNDAVCKDPKFVSVQAEARLVRDHRNHWAHCDFQHWSKQVLQDSFSALESLLSGIYGSPTAAPANVLTQLHMWRDIGKDFLVYYIINISFCIFWSCTVKSQNKLQIISY